MTTIPLPFCIIKLLAKYIDLSTIILDDKLDSVLVRTSTEARKYTNDEIQAFLTNGKSPITSLLVMRKFLIHGVYRYTMEEYTRRADNLTVSCYEVEKRFYESMIVIFNM